MKTTIRVYKDFAVRYDNEKSLKAVMKMIKQEIEPVSFNVIEHPGIKSGKLKFDVMSKEVAG